uniref:Serpentine receptor class gamma n=1 Tax=Panagrellus redivivus TaxID=6233 RepID=A0A7E4ZY50_PANRE
MLPSGLGEVFFIIRQISNSGMIEFPRMIVIERMYSIINAKTYEKWFSWTFIIIICGSSWLSSFWIMANMFYLSTLFPISWTYAISDVLLIAVYALYFFFYFFTGKKMLTGLPLSERYQRVENKGSYKTMLKFAIILALILAVSSSYLIVSQFVPYFFENVTMHDKEAFIRYINDILVDCCILVLPYQFVHVHPSLAKRYRNVFLFTIFKCSRVSVVNDSTHTVQIKSATGRDLTLPDESSYYFKSLSDQWNGKLDHTAQNIITEVPLGCPEVHTSGTKI